MKYLPILAFAMLTIAGIGCSNSPFSPDGNWTRPISEDELGSAGTELLSFTPDSAFTIANNMVFEHADSVFNCNVYFKTYVSGHWQAENNTITLFPDPETFRLDTIPGHVRITLRDGELADSIRQAMAKDLTVSLGEYYHTVYESVAETEGLLLENAMINNGMLAAVIEDSLIVRWTKL